MGVPGVARNKVSSSIVTLFKPSGVKVVEVESARNTRSQAVPELVTDESGYISFRIWLAELPDWANWSMRASVSLLWIVGAKTFCALAVVAKDVASPKTPANIPMTATRAVATKAAGLNLVALGCGERPAALGCGGLLTALGCGKPVGFNRLYGRFVDMGKLGRGWVLFCKD